MTSLSPHSPDTPSFRKLFVVEAKPKRNKQPTRRGIPQPQRLFAYAQSDGVAEKRFTRHASPNPIDSVSLTKIIHPITKSEFFC